VTTTIVHRTPGLIDPRAFTLMGVSAKPNSQGHAIGMFGTGLKYAIATLVRLDAQVTVWIGRDKYEFRKVHGVFREQDIEEIIFYRTRWSALRRQRVALPFTASYGKFWKPWMAFRELHSNTLDEGGETMLVDSAVMGMENFTTIVVEHPEYVEAWENRDDIFLPDASRQRDMVKGVEIVEGEGQRLYYRGLRVHDLPKPSLHTYNFVSDMQLTEDRTLYLGDYYARQNVAMAVLASEDEAFIHKVVTAGEDFWEHELEFPSYISPGEAFTRVMTRRTRGYSRSSWGYYSGRVDNSMNSMGRRAPEVTLDKIRTLSHPAPWTYDEVEYQITDRDGEEVLRFPEGMDDDVCRVLAREILVRLEMIEVEEPEEAPEEDDPGGCDCEASLAGNGPPHHPTCPMYTAPSAQLEAIMSEDAEIPF
jgi:hypothetical protein